MSPAPVLSRLGEALRERTAPLAPDDDANGWVHAHLCQGIEVQLERVEDIWDPPDPVAPGGPLLDVDLCPDWALPWLGQLVGVRIPPGTSAQDARTLVRSVAGFSRGTPDAIRAAAGLYLIGSKTVYFNERVGNHAYRLGVLTLTTETPDAEAVQRAILAQKPAGILLDYRSIAGQTYGAIRIEYDTYREVRDAYDSYRAMMILPKSEVS